MAQAGGTTAFPTSVEVTLRNPRSGEQRTYEQTELTIEGEARLLGLVQQVGKSLSETDFPWDKLNDLFDPMQPGIDWPSAIAMLGSAAAVMPEAVTEACCIFFGLYPTNEDGTRNPEYDADRRFVKSAVSFTRFSDFVRTFADQNDYQRLAVPFGRALATGARAMTPSEPTSEPSAPSTLSSSRVTALSGASSGG